MNELNMDPALAAILGELRGIHAPIWQAIEDGRPVTDFDCAILSGVVQALLSAIDARRPQPEPPAAILLAVAA